MSPPCGGADDDPSGVGLWSRVFGNAERPALADGAELACCAPDGVGERTALASRMLEIADAAGSAWLEIGLAGVQGI